MAKIKRRKWELGFDSTQANFLVSVIKKHKVANTELIVSKMQKKYRGFSGVTLRALKNQVNDSILPVIIASDVKGYYICDNKEKLSRYVDSLIV